jgi:hypothetical protein
MSTNVTYDRDAGNGRPRWRTTVTGDKKQLLCLIYCNGRLYKAKKFPTLESALRWALDLQRAVEAGIESDPV